MKSSDGSIVRRGDKVRASDGLSGTVVASIDTGECSDDQRQHLKEGILVETTEAGLVHYTDKNVRLERERKGHDDRSA